MASGLINIYNIYKYIILIEFLNVTSTPRNSSSNLQGAKEVSLVSWVIGEGTEQKIKVKVSQIIPSFSLQTLKQQIGEDGTKFQQMFDKHFFDNLASCLKQILNFLNICFEQLRNTPRVAQNCPKQGGLCS